MFVYDGYLGGKGYTSAPTVTIAAPAGTGTQATAVSLIESRLYGDIVNRIAIDDTDSIQSSDIPAETVNLTRVVNTSAGDNNNWVPLSSNSVSVGSLTGPGVVSTTLLGAGAANSFTFLRGDESYALVVQSLKGAEVRYFDRLYSTANSGSNQLIFLTNSDVLIGHEVVNSVLGIQANTNITGIITAAGLTTVSLNNPLTQTINAGTIIEFERGASPITFESSYTQGNFVDDIIIANGGSGFTDGQYFDVELQGGTGTGLTANIVVSGNSVTDVTVTSGGSGYNNDFSITVAPAVIGSGSSLVLDTKISTVNRQYANVSIDVQRVTDLTISADLYGTIGVSRFKKDQFKIGEAGNGSIELRTGPNSGLDADLLDTKQGSFYLNSSNQNAGTLPTDRLAGTYNISVSGSSGNTIRLSTGTNNPTSNPTPNNFVEGLVANTINNSADQLNDGGSQHLVLSIRNKGQGLTAEGGVRQMAFTDNDNIWLRGSGTGVTAFGSWAKMWTSLNDGIDSGLDADRLDGRQGTWYQNALNVNFGTLSDNRLPTFMSAKKVRNSLTIQTFNGDPKYRIYISGRILNTTPFTPGSTVNLYNANAQSTGVVTIDNLIINDDTADNTNDYTIIVGRLTTGNFVGALTIGTASNREQFRDFTIEDDNVIEVAKLESDGGTANLRLGRADGQATSPGIYFTSAQLAPSSYNTAIIATGGNATDGSGTLNALVADANGFNINGNVIWNAGNITFQSANVANTAVKRDANGNFDAGTITANLTGSASLNVLIAGDDMTGTLNITGAGSNFSVQGTATMLSSASVASNFAVDTDTLYVDATNDRVAINHTNPLKVLDIKSGNDDAITLNNTFGDDSNGIGFAVGSSAPWVDFRGGRLDIKANSTTGTWNNGDFRLMSLVHDQASNTSGKVGINTTSPNANFEVTGNAILATNTAYDVDTYNNKVFAGAIGDGSWGLSTGIGGRSGTGHAWGLGSNGANFYMGYGNGASNDSLGTFIRVAPDRNMFLNEGASQGGVAIKTNVLSGTDPETSQNRTYVLNVGGDMNINGQLFQNNAEFVTSRWTEATNNTDIYRLSNVGINQVDPDYTLDINGDTNVRGVFRINGAPQHLDTYGIVKSNPNVLDEDITVPANTNAFMCGDITVANNRTITVGATSTFVII